MRWFLAPTKGKIPLCDFHSMNCEEIECDCAEPVCDDRRARA